MNQRVGIVAMSCKPMHAGHMQLINIASRENDVVKLFVSLNDRKRDGEIPIYGEDMDYLWKTYIQKSLPSNVEVVYSIDKTKTPIRLVYEFLGNADDANTYVIYSDPNDIEKNFSNSQLQKYLNRLQKTGKIQLEPVNRTQTTDISGTKMRQWLASGDKESFIANLPEMLQDAGEEIWNTFQVSASIR